MGCHIVCINPLVTFAVSTIFHTVKFHFLARKHYYRIVNDGIVWHGKWHFRNITIGLKCISTTREDEKEEETPILPEPPFMFKRNVQIDVRQLMSCWRAIVFLYCLSDWHDFLPCETSIVYLSYDCVKKQEKRKYWFDQTVGTHQGVCCPLRCLNVSAAERIFCTPRAFVRFPLAAACHAPEAQWSIPQCWYGSCQP